VSVDGDQAAMTLSAMATVRVRGGVGAFHTGRWHLDWLRESDGWKISAIKPEIVDTIPFDTLSDLRGRLPR
jgi:hypothetical protein